MFLVAVLLLTAYLVAGTALLNRGMAYVRAHALHDTQFLSMAVMDGRSLSMTLPKLVFIVSWLPVLLIVALFLILRAMFRSDDMTAAAI